VGPTIVVEDVPHAIPEAATIQVATHAAFVPHRTRRALAAMWYRSIAELMLPF
jgi:hypothetical protein